MIARKNSVLTRQIFSGFASLYLTAIGSFIYLLAVWEYDPGRPSGVPRSYSDDALFIAAKVLFVTSFVLALPVIFKTRIFKLPNLVLFRLAMATCICTASLVSGHFIMKLK